MSSDQPRVEFAISHAGTDLGTFTVALEPSKAPKTVENFLAYVDAGYFDNTIFHRILPTFMIQGGGYDAEFQPKRGERPSVENEAASGVSNQRGAIAMARTNDPHSATAQFFINVADNDFLNHPGQDGWGYCAFGNVVDGMDVIDKIKAVPTTLDPVSGEEARPVDPPTVTSAKRL